ncbi:MAG: Asp-tRNA(Asn)/Glu-tRNA(Gln) amidotransferase subunit GatA [Coxiellaceae bacterium]|nr:Asp-tRNA(Asn)/Glu-tRNA(Gln) amidotransferase subunit GatA [Coxiellaceae bacterium]
MHSLSLRELQQQLDDKKISSVELTQHFVQRIKQHDNTLNSFITVCDDTAMQQAKIADQRRANGEQHPLLGIPLAQKDLFCTTGIKTSCASKMLDNFIAPYESHVSQQCLDAGMVMLGKTNMDEFAMGSSNENSYYGAAHNPWNTDCTPGGSSGGSAAAVAAGLTPVATGTDTGGSIRQPAAFCGLTGIKPTYGRVSRYGMIAFASSLDQGGVFARSADDAALLLQTIAGHDSRDSTSVDQSVPDYSATLNDSLEGLRIGIPEEYFSHDLSAAITESIQASIKQLEQLGAEIVDVKLPHTHLATSAYYVLAPAEASANLARYDGLRYGYRCDNPTNLDDLYTRSRTEAFGEEVKRRILVGTYALSSGYYDAYYSQAQKVRRLIRDDFTKAFEKVDMILTPTTPTTAFKIGEIKDPVQMYLADIFTIAVNLAGLPGLSMPCGFDQGLPIGVQLIGNYFEEGKILNCAHQYQLNTDWHTKRPTVTPDSIRSQGK